ncbi:MAG: cobalamin biosynthesis protein CbiG [Ruminococcaceae bacterium]|jgi:cobalt-precorrin 5A hydrolase|nr:cobalamin biosynthesis protein CbiG [Oscillospiraceae bacterium]
MTVSLIAFSRNGAAVMDAIAGRLSDRGETILEACLLHGNSAAQPSLREWTTHAFCGDAVIFVGACGIAVRAIAPLIRDKLEDPAVICVDERGQFVIPLLSGHVGGANALAAMIAKAVGGTPVITTATDVQGRFAVDVWAKNCGLRLCERQYAKELSAALLDGETVGVFSDFLIDGSLPDGMAAADSGNLGLCVSWDTQVQPFLHTLHAVPQTVTVGVGCRRNVSAEAFEHTVLDFLRQNRIAIEAVASLATIDLKSNEPCIRAFCEKYRLPLVTASAQTLASVEGEFTASEFVGKVTGVDNVCERAAVLAGGGTLLFRKQSRDAVTVAASSPDWRVCFEGKPEGIYP